MMFFLCRHSCSQRMNPTDFYIIPALHCQREHVSKPTLAFNKAPLCLCAAPQDRCMQTPLSLYPSLLFPLICSAISPLLKCLLTKLKQLAVFASDHHIPLQHISDSKFLTAPKPRTEECVCVCARLYASTHTRYEDILVAKCVRQSLSSVCVIDCMSCWPNVSVFSLELGEKSVISSKAPFEKPRKPVIAKEKAGEPAKPNT